MKTARALCFTLLFCSTASLINGATLIEDFSYMAGSLKTKGSTGGGWSGSWGPGSSTSRILVNQATNLSYTGGGYAINQSGIGHAYGDYGNDFRGINRSLSTSLTGTIWFSYLFENNSANDHTGILFNQNGTNDYDLGTNYSFDATGTTYALNSTHLVLGRLIMGAGNDSLSIWVDPTDINSLGTADFTDGSKDIGTSLTKAGFFSYSDNADSTPIPHGKFDALRISDGGGDSTAAFTAITGVPEPSACALVFGGLSLLLLRRKVCS